VRTVEVFFAETNYCLSALYIVNGLYNNYFDFYAAAMLGTGGSSEAGKAEELSPIAWSNEWEAPESADRWDSCVKDEVEEMLPDYSTFSLGATVTVTPSDEGPGEDEEGYLFIGESLEKVFDESGADGFMPSYDLNQINDNYDESQTDDNEFYNYSTDYGNYTRRLWGGDADNYADCDFSIQQGAASYDLLFECELTISGDSKGVCSKPFQSVQSVPNP